MEKKKVFILLPDGVGLRNFAYSKFYEIGKQKGNDVVFWNNTNFPIKELGYDEIKITGAKTHPITDILKSAKVHVTLNLFSKKASDTVYQTYKFPFSYRNTKATVKSLITRALISLNSSAKGLRKLEEKINVSERKTFYYHQCKETLETEKPDILFCTNQRHVLSIAPILAAKDLGIPTATFIFSWDNLPKATMIIETDYYVVWSEYMKQELLSYYPNIKANQIFVTGTPQFEMHFDGSKLMSREDFLAKYHLDPNKKYICFSGDDFTSSPDDEKYLEDLAKAVIRLNAKGHNLGIIFRRCPVDFSSRYDAVLEKYSELVVSIDPLWKAVDSNWQTVLPTKEDDTLLSSLAEHTELVVNLGSSTVFDFASHNKPCGYFRYNQKEKILPQWDIFTCYKFVHFRSMFSEHSVLWLDSPEAIDQIIEDVLENGASHTVNDAKKWFEKINQHPPELASERIWAAIQQLIQN